MTQPTTDRQIRLENAELLRALVTSVDTVQSNMNAMQTQVSEIRDKVIGIEARDHGSLISNLSARLSLLEQENQRREGAVGVVSTILKSPTLAWLVGGATLLWAVITNKLNT